MFEQLSPIYKWIPCRLQKGQSCPRRRASLATNAKPRWATRGATTFTLCKVVSDVGSGSADAVVGLQVRALNEHVVSPGAAPVHTELTALGQHGAGELLGRELAVLTSVLTISGVSNRAKTCSMTSLALPASSVIAAGHVHHHGEVNEAPRYRDVVGRVQRPDRVGSRNYPLAQQVGVDLAVVLRARVGWRRPALSPQRASCS